VALLLLLNPECMPKSTPIYPHPASLTKRFSLLTPFSNYCYSWFFKLYVTIYLI
jgi:hypothetical protein